MLVMTSLSLVIFLMVVLDAGLPFGDGWMLLRSTSMRTSLAALIASGNR